MRATEPLATPTSKSARIDISSLPAEARVSDGGGEPRTPGYWAAWNSCAEGNQAEVAAANGGAEAGWFLVDDFLAPPGVRAGDYAITTCEQALNVLQASDTSSAEKGGDAAYPLAAHLLAAQLNMGVGAEFCPAAQEAVLAGHVLLASVGFDGTGDRIRPEHPDYDSALTLAEMLDLYNNGLLCSP